MPRPFIVVFVARSGSGTLMFDLDQHEQIRMASEVMGGRYLPQGRELTDENRLVWLRQWWKTRKRARGFKFQFSLGAPQFDDLPRLAQEILIHEAIVFRLGRRDRVRHAISALRAQQLMPITEQVLGTEIGHIRTTDPDELQAFRKKPVVIDPTAFRYMVQGIESAVQGMDAFLAGLEDVRSIYYEDYQADRLNVLNTVAAAVEVEPFEAPPAETIRKVSSDNLREAVANYEEIVAAAADLGLQA